MKQELILVFSHCFKASLKLAFTSCTAEFQLGGLVECFSSGRAKKHGVYELNGVMGAKVEKHSHWKESNMIYIKAFTEKIR